MSNNTDVIAALQRENAKLRELLWATHSCPGKYGDDGELQCGACVLDFKRDPTELIEQRLHERGMRWIADAQWHVCAFCRAQRFTHQAAQPCSANQGMHRWIRLVALRDSPEFADVLGRPVWVLEDPDTFIAYAFATDLERARWLLDLIERSPMPPAAVGKEM